MTDTMEIFWEFKFEAAHQVGYLAGPKSTHVGCRNRGGMKTREGDHPRNLLGVRPMKL